MTQHYKNQITATTVANISIEDAWTKLSDLSIAHFYVPDLTACDITTEQTTGVGASRIVKSNRPPMIETVVEWNEGAGFLLRLHHDKGDGMPPLFSNATFRYAINEESATTTRLTNTLSYNLKFGIFGSMLGAMIKKTMQRMQEQVTVGQRLYYETGKKVALDDVIKVIKLSKTA